MLQVLTNQRAVVAAAGALRRQLERGRRSHHELGVQGETLERTIYWHSDAGVWAVQVRAHNRYWQAFGLRDPRESGHLNIDAEINPPLAGINRRVAGVFLSDGKATYLGHRGSPINQTPKVAFRRHFATGPAGRWVRVEDGDRRPEVILLGRLDDAAIMEAIARFTREVLRIKRLVRRKK